MTTTIYTTPSAARPTEVYGSDDLPLQIHVDAGNGVYLVFNDPARAFALADALLLAGQRLEAAHLTAPLPIPTAVPA